MNVPRARVCCTVNFQPLTNLLLRGLHVGLVLDHYGGHEELLASEVLNHHAQHVLLDLRVHAVRLCVYVIEYERSLAERWFQKIQDSARFEWTQCALPGKPNHL